MQRLVFHSDTNTAPPSITDAFCLSKHDEDEPLSPDTVSNRTPGASAADASKRTRKKVVDFTLSKFVEDLGCEREGEQKKLGQI